MRVDEAIRDQNYIMSLERGLRILEVFAGAGRPLTLTEVAAHCGFNKTATQRFLHTLNTLGYIYRDGSKKYRLGAKIMSLGFGYLNNSDLRAICKPHVDRISTEVNRTVNLGILDDLDVVYLYRREVTRYLKYDLYAGSRVPSYCAAMGKVLLAGLPDDDLLERIARMSLKPITRRTITSKRRLWDELMVTRSRGYSISDRELSMDLYSLAVPLLDEEQTVIAALNATMDQREADTGLRDDILARLLEAGRQVSAILGCTRDAAAGWSGRS